MKTTRKHAKSQPKPRSNVKPDDATATKANSLVISSVSLAIAVACYGVTSIGNIAHAGPENGVVVSGNGSISKTAAQTLIQQNSQNMAINWDSYNVASGERVQYIQPNSQSVSLNRILSSDGSRIAGNIDANGKVILVNPNGILFTQTATLNVGSLVASSLNITPDNFINGNYVFDAIENVNGAVINHGIINASVGGNGGGSVTL